ncbi:MAG TPA: hypothetical protein VMZ92_09220 [Planctomycetota bacterium]|nr:hypothetical protein [Planctomycetota bacterium]
MSEEITEVVDEEEEVETTADETKPDGEEKPTETVTPAEGEPSAEEESADEKSADYWRGRAEALEDALKGRAAEPDEDDDATPSEEQQMETDLEKLRGELKAVDDSISDLMDADEKTEALVKRSRISDQIADKRVALAEAKSDRKLQTVALRTSEQAYRPMVDGALTDFALPESAYNEVHKASSAHLRSKGFGPQRPPTDDDVAESLELVAGRIARGQKTGGTQRRGPKVAEPATGTRRGAPAKTGLAAIPTGKDATEEAVTEAMKKEGLIP